LIGVCACFQTSKLTVSETVAPSTKRKWVTTVVGTSTLILRPALAPRGMMRSLHVMRAIALSSAGFTR